MDGLRKMFKSLMEGGQAKEDPADRSSPDSDLQRQRPPRHPYYRRPAAWVPDEKASQCASCRRHFDFIRRKHHCRRCGEIFCGACCHVRLPLRRMGFVDAVRQCKPCLDITKKEEDFTARYLTTLEQGARFMVLTQTQSVTSEPGEVRVHVPSNYRLIAFEGTLLRRVGDTMERLSVPPIEISQIIAVTMLLPTPDTELGPGLTPGIGIRHYDHSGRIREVAIRTTPGGPNSSLQRGAAWCDAVQAACKLFDEPVMPFSRSGLSQTEVMQD